MPTPIFQITRYLWLGPFASPQRVDQLRAAGITHVLNVSEAPSILTPQTSGMADIRWHPLEDLQYLRTDLVLGALDALHTMVSHSNSSVYVHCIAGQNRSPTVLWLYFVACGVHAEEARELISRRAMDAVPGHGQLVGEGLIVAAERHGKTNFLPLKRPGIIEPP